MIAPSDPPIRKTSIIDDEEDIEVKLPVDLISDEFLRDGNEKILVELIYNEEDEEAVNFKNFLEKLGYTVSRNVNYDYRNTPDDTWLGQVKYKIIENKYQGLIMVFAKVGYKNEDMKKIWSKFTAPNCPTLKNRPKIFIFQIQKRMKSEIDGIDQNRRNWSATYDTPAEADMAVIFDRDELDKTDFLYILSYYINQHGETEDLTTILSLCGRHKTYQPLIMSTMTGRFFFKPHAHRGNHHKLHTKSDKVIEHVKTIHTHVTSDNNSDVVVSKEPKKKGMLQKLAKRFSSFRKSSNKNGNSDDVKVATSTSKDVGSTREGVKVKKGDSLKVSTVASRVVHSGPSSPIPQIKEQPSKISEEILRSRDTAASTSRAKIIDRNGVNDRLRAALTNPSSEPTITRQEKTSQVEDLSRDNMKITRQSSASYSEEVHQTPGSRTSTIRSQRVVQTLTSSSSTGPSVRKSNNV